MWCTRRTSAVSSSHSRFQRGADTSASFSTRHLKQDGMQRRSASQSDDVWMWLDPSTSKRASAVNRRSADREIVGKRIHPAVPRAGSSSKVQLSHSVRRPRSLDTAPRRGLSSFRSLLHRVISEQPATEWGLRLCAPRMPDGSRSFAYRPFGAGRPNAGAMTGCGP
jgi:hypothetical protein